MSDFNTYAYTPNCHLPYPDDSNENIDLIENLTKLAEATDGVVGGGLIINKLTSNLVITDGNTPSLAEGYYYTSTYHVTVNGDTVNGLDDAIFYFSTADTDFEFQLIKIWGSGLGYPYVAIDRLAGENEIFVQQNAPVLASQIVTSISSSSTDRQTPSAKCIYDNYVTNTDYATSGVGGVIKTSDTNGFGITSSGYAQGTTKTYSQYDRWS